MILISYFVSFGHSNYCNSFDIVDPNYQHFSIARSSTSKRFRLGSSNFNYFLTGFLYENYLTQIPTFPAAKVLLDTFQRPGPTYSSSSTRLNSAYRRHQIPRPPAEQRLCILVVVHLYSKARPQ